MNEAERLESWMKEKGFNISSLAEAIGDSYSTVWFIVKGERPVNDAFKWRFALRFGYDEATRLFASSPLPNPQSSTPAEVTA